MYNFKKEVCLMYEDLSQKQIEILLYIKSEIQRQGYPPAVREICKGVELKSTSTVHGHLEKLESRGYIRKDPTKPRAIEILDKNDDFLSFINEPIIAPPIAGNIQLNPNGASGSFDITGTTPHNPFATVNKLTIKVTYADILNILSFLTCEHVNDNKTKAISTG